MHWYLEAFTKKYATFGGRATRQEYWMFILFHFIALVVAAVVDGVVGTSGVVYGLYSLASLVPLLAVGVRRLHDANHSGWWMLISIVAFIFSLMKGTEGANRFGPDPKAAAVAA